MTLPLRVSDMSDEHTHAIAILGALAAKWKHEHAHQSDSQRGEGE